MAKANQQLSFVRRNIRTRSSSKKLYNTLVRPHIEYAATVWNPHISKQKHSLEMVQRRAARWVTNKYHNTPSVSDMLHTLGWKSLEHLRATSRLCMLFQIYRGSIGIPQSVMIIIMIQTYSTTLTSNICIPSQHTSAGLTILNVLSSLKQLLLGMHSLKVWSLARAAPHWMHSRRHWGDGYQASVFERATFLVLLCSNLF